MYIVFIIIAIFVLIILSLLIWTWYHPESFLIPLNLLYSNDSSQRTKFYTSFEKNIIFPASLELESFWLDIKSEGYNLYESLSNKTINYLNQYNINIGSESKSNWTTIPLRLFGCDSVNYMSQCPKLSSFLHSHPEVISCIFSIMSPGKIINPHVGPYDGLLRYQLALDIPKTNMHDECYLHVGGEKYYWTEGEGILFDEANLHGAVNTTSHKRMVLLIDIERPYNFLPFTLLNKLIITCLGLLPATKQATFA